VFRGDSQHTICIVETRPGTLLLVYLCFYLAIFEKVWSFYKFINHNYDIMRRMQTITTEKISPFAIAAATGGANANAITRAGGDFIFTTQI